MNFPADLLPGDIIGALGMAIVRDATDGAAGHVTVYLGDGNAATANPSNGVNIYPVDISTAVWVRRAKQPVNTLAGLAWFATVIGQPYGWNDILRDTGLPINGENGAMDCSHVSTLFMLHAGAPQFDPSYDPSRVTPADFEKTFESVELWSVMPSNPAPLPSTPATPWLLPPFSKPETPFAPAAPS